MTPAMTILYVRNTAASADFYARIFELPPTEKAETFSLFRLPTGLVLGLWTQNGVEPEAPFTGGGCELAIRAPAASDVDRLHSHWSQMGISILQTPTEADFGRTFTAADPDGHRIRVFNPPA